MRASDSSLPIKSKGDFLKAYELSVYPLQSLYRLQIITTAATIKPM